MNGNGRAPREVVWQHGKGRHRALVRLYAFAGGIIVIVALAAGAYAVFGPVRGGSWVTVGSTSDVMHHDVTFDERVGAFVVGTGSELMAFSASDVVSARRVYYCSSSGWFESADGISKFDHHGFYREGPAGRALDRIAVREEHGFVTVNPSERTPGPPGSVTDGGQPAGQYCSGRGDTPDPNTGRWVEHAVSGRGTS